MIGLAERREMGPEFKVVQAGELTEVASAVYLLASRLEEAFTPRVATGKAAGLLVVALNMSGLGGRANVEVWVKSSGAADFLVEGSVDGVNWRLVDTITLTGAGERHEGYPNAYPYVRVRTDAANDNEIEICGSR